MPGSGGLGVPGPAGEVRSVPAPSVLCPPHPVSGQESLGVQEPHLLGEEAEGGSSYACGPDLGGLDLAGIGAQSAGNWRPHLHLSENPETPHRRTPRHCSPPPAGSPGSGPSPGPDPGPGPAECAGRPTGGGAGAGPGGVPANGAGPCPPRARLRPAPPRRRRAAELPALFRPRCPVRSGPRPRRSPAAGPGSGPARSQARGNCRRPPPLWRSQGW